MAALDQTIETEYGEIFHRALITDHFIFFTNDSDGIMMFYIDDLERRPLGGYGAEELLIEVILKGEWNWASEDMKYNKKKTVRLHHEHALALNQMNFKE